MIKPNELTKARALSYESKIRNENLLKIEKQFDDTITNYQLELIKGKSIICFVNNEQNKSGEMLEIVEKYKKEGWLIKIDKHYNRSYQIVEIKINTYEKPI